MISLLSNLFKKKSKYHSVKRERLKLLHYIKTNGKDYYVYNTQTIESDWVNIEIEMVDNCNNKTIILQKELFEDSWGAMGGTAFSGLVQDAVNHLRDYIKHNNEFIIENKII